MAVIGDAGWMSVWATIFDPVTKPDLRHFKTDQREEAQAWLHESEPHLTRSSTAQTARYSLGNREMMVPGARKLLGFLAAARESPGIT